MYHGSEGSILAGLPEEACLCLITDLGSLEEPVQGGQGSMAPLLDPAPPEPFGPRRGVLPCPDLLQQGHGGLEHIGTQGKEGLQLPEVGKLILSLKPAVSQAPADQGPVLALHGTVVILVPGTGRGETDAMGITELRCIISRPGSG